MQALLLVYYMRDANGAGYRIARAVHLALAAADADVRIDPVAGETGALSRRADFIHDVSYIFVAEILQSAQNGVSRSLAEAAQRAGMNGLCNFLKSVEILELALTLGYTLKYAQHLGYALTAGRALAA